MAKSGIQGLAVGRQDIFKVDPRELTVEPDWNCRDFSDPDNLEHIERLKESIRLKGVQEPLTVRMSNGRVVVTNGECRLRAVNALLAEGMEIKSVPVQTEARNADEAAWVESQITRNSGKPFSPLEQARVFERLINLGRTEEQIGAAAGISAERVRQVLALNRVTEPTKALIRDGKIAATTVQRVLEKHKDPETVERTLLDAGERAAAEGREKIKPRDVRPPTAADDNSDLIGGPAPKTNAAARRDFRALLAEVLSYATDVAEDGTMAVFVPAQVWDRVKDIRT